MKIKTLIIGSFIIAGILTGCNGQSATTTAETQTTTEIESTTESESTTSEIALENEKGMTSFSSTQGKTSDTIEETEPAPAIEDVTITEEEIAAKFDESVFTEDVTEAQKERMRAFAAETNMSYTEMADDNSDGKVNSEEVQSLIEFYEWVTEEYNNDVTPSSGTTGGGSETGDSSKNYIGPTIGTPDSGELPPGLDLSQVDTSDLSPTAHTY